MLTHIEENRDLREYNILTFHLRGKLDSVSFKNSMRKLITEMEYENHMNIYMEVSSIEGVEFETIWDSLKFAFTSMKEYIRSLDKVALVTDTKWLGLLAKIEDKVLPDVNQKVFSFDDRDEALRWLKAA